MFDISLVKYVGPVEITRNNWIIGGYQDNQEDIYYELHFCNNEVYKYGLLIDDVWANNLFSVDAPHKVDIYILYNIDETHVDDFFLDTRYSYFLQNESVQKCFLCFDELDSGSKEVLSKYKDIHSEYPQESDNTLLSIVTTVYNNSFLLEQTIQSVINQKCNYYEYIIKDACSNDGIEEIVRKYGKFGIIFVSKKDCGIYDGMEQGFKVAKGEYVQILNSDDVFHDNIVVNRYIEEFWKKEADAYCSDIVLCFPDGKRIVRQPNLKKLRYQSCINHTSLALKRTDYFRLGGFDKNMSIASDCDLTIKIMKSGLCIKYIPLICVNFRMGGTSSNISLKQLKEGLVCRCRYSKWNIDGCVFTLLQYLKNRFFK